MKRLPIWMSFTWSCVFALIVNTSFFPSIKLWSFAPFLVIQFYQVNFTKALWLSFFAGLVVDVFSSQFPFGMMALTHTATTFLLYGQRKHFFEDKTFAFFLYTALVSSFLSLFTIVFSAISSKQITVTLPLLISDLLIMPFSDALYGLVAFTLPSNAYFVFKKVILKRHLQEEENT